MSKKSETYRGEDKTLELIRDKYNEIAQTVPGDTPDQETKSKIWCAACYHLIDQFKAEGLHNTQKQIEAQINVHYSIEELQPFYNSDNIEFNKPSFANCGAVKGFKSGLIVENVEEWAFASGGKLSMERDERRFGIVGHVGPELILPPTKKD